MDFQSMMETFAEAWVAANTQTPLTDAAAAADHQNLMLGLSGTPTGPGLDISSANEALNRRLAGSSGSAAHSPGFNLSSHHQSSATAEDEPFSPAFASTILDLKDAISGNNGRNTIPIHCIIERANSSLTSPANSGSSSNSNCQQQQQSTAQLGSSPSLSQSHQSVTDLASSVSSSAISHHLPSSSLPGGSGGPGGGSATGGNGSNPNTTVEQDTYAILSASIPFQDICRSVLTKLGYAPQEMVGAKALIQLRNWKPLTLDQICESVEATLGDIFGDIASFITLRIRLFRPRMSAAHELKDKLLQVLLAHSYSLLTNSGGGGGGGGSGGPGGGAGLVGSGASPIDQQILSSLMRGRADPQQEVNEDARRRMDQWYLQQVFNQYRQFALAAQQAQQHQASVPGMRPNAGASAAPSPHSLFMDLNLANGGPDSSTLAAVAGIHPSLAAAAAAAAAASARPTTNGNITSSNSSNSEKTYGSKQGNNVNHNSSSGHHSSITSSRTRIRTSFDPELELPKLHKWFSENRHPSRSQVQEFVKELNALESRKGRKPLDVNNVVYWFKNARAAHKRAELKFISNDSNPGSHSVYSAFAQNNVLSADYFINGGNHSPGKASSDASVSGKGNDDPLSNASRNGSNMDDYYSFDEDADSREETQTLDLSMRNNLVNMRSKMFSGSPISNDIKLEQDETEEIQMDEAKCDSNSNVDNDQIDIKQEFLDHSGRNTDCGASSDCNSIEEDSEDDSEAATNNLIASAILSRNSANLVNLNNSNHGSHPESPEARRTRRSRTFIDPMSEVPRLESWFLNNTHPAHSQIVRYTEELNKLPYRQKFPKLEPKNIQFWFKNRRAKIKRTSGLTNALAGLSPANKSGSVATSNSSSIHNSSALNIERLINAH